MKPYLIGITGGTASGKSFVAKKLQEIDPQNILNIGQDNYYRDFYRCIPHEKRKNYNFDYPGAIDSRLLYDHIHALLQGRPVAMPVYSFTADDCILHTVEIMPKPVIIIEGILALSNPLIRELINLKIFVEVDPDIRLSRRLLRDLEERHQHNMKEVLDMYLNSAAPNYRRFIEPKKQYADIILYNNRTLQDFDTSIDVIGAKVREIIADHRASL